MGESFKQWRAYISIFMRFLSSEGISRSKWTGSSHILVTLEAEQVTPGQLQKSVPVQLPVTDGWAALKVRRALSCIVATSAACIPYGGSLDVHKPAAFAPPLQQLPGPPGKFGQSLPPHPPQVIAQHAVPPSHIPLLQNWSVSPSA